MKNTLTIAAFLAASTASASGYNPRTHDPVVTPPASVRAPVCDTLSNLLMGCDMGDKAKATKSRDKPDGKPTPDKPERGCEPERGNDKPSKGGHSKGGKGGHDKGQGKPGKSGADRDKPSKGGKGGRGKGGRGHD